MTQMIFKLAPHEPASFNAVVAAMMSVVLALAVGVNALCLYSYLS